MPLRYASAARDAPCRTTDPITLLYAGGGAAATSFEQVTHSLQLGKGRT